MERGSLANYLRRTLPPPPLREPPEEPREELPREPDEPRDELPLDRPLERPDEPPRVPLDFPDDPDRPEDVRPTELPEDRVVGPLRVRPVPPFP